MLATSRDQPRAHRPRPHWARRAGRAITDAIGRWLDDLAVPRMAIDDLNDRMLADIGLSRVDLEAVRSGIVPPGPIGHCPQPCAEVCVLRRATCGTPRRFEPEEDLSIAA